jgi:hypothetical protein
MERSTIFNGKIHYKSPFSIAMLNYQRVLFFADFGVLVPFLEASGDQPKSDAHGTCRVAEGHLYTLLILFWVHR